MAGHWRVVGRNELEQQLEDTKKQLDDALKKVNMEGVTYWKSKKNEHWETLDIGISTLLEFNYLSKVKELVVERDGTVLRINFKDFYILEEGTNKKYQIQRSR
jgi:hypothetical protein